MLFVNLAPTASDRLMVEAFDADAYLIGGRVRDLLLAQMRGTTVVSKDADYLVVGRTLEDVAARLERAGARVDPVGASFAVLKVTIDGETVDVALPRRERSTGAGHRDFAVDFGPEVSLEDDMRRRDFTINAISLRLCDSRIFALDSALDDLRNGILRTTHPRSFVDDPLRMLRAVQFASRFGFSLDGTTAAQLRAHRALLATVSPERTQEEVSKLLLKSPAPSVGLQLLADCDLLGATLPELAESIGVEQNAFHRYDVFGHLLHAVDTAATQGGDLIDRLAAVLHDVGKPRTIAPRPDGQGNSFHNHEVVGAEMTRAILGRLRYSGEVVETVTSLVRHHMYLTTESNGCALPDRALRRFIMRVGPDRVERQFALRRADVIGGGTKTLEPGDHNDCFQDRVRAIMAEVPALSITDLAIGGREVIDLLVGAGYERASFRGGPIVGQILRAALERVLDDPAANTIDALREQALREAKAIYVPPQDVALLRLHAPVRRLSGPSISL